MSKSAKADFEVIARSGRNVGKRIPSTAYVASRVALKLHQQAETYNVLSHPLVQLAINHLLQGDINVLFRSRVEDPAMASFYAQMMEGAVKELSGRNKRQRVLKAKTHLRKWEQQLAEEAESWRKKINRMLEKWDEEDQVTLNRL